jgi:hypothetical protein
MLATRGPMRPRSRVISGRLLSALKSRLVGFDHVTVLTRWIGGCLRRDKPQPVGATFSDRDMLEDLIGCQASRLVVIQLLDLFEAERGSCPTCTC